MICLEQDGATGYLRPVDPQPSDVSACVMVIQSPGEVSSAPWAFTESQASEIAGAILLLWGGAFIVRMLIRALSIGNFQEENP